MAAGDEADDGWDDELTGNASAGNESTGSEDAADDGEGSPGATGTVACSPCS